MGKAVIPLFCIALLGYFGHNAFEGRLGIKAKAVMDSRADALRLELEQLKLEKNILKNRVALLRTESLEHDMLDEQARYHLYLTRADEMVIFRGR